MHVLTHAERIAIGEPLRADDAQKTAAAEARARSAWAARRIRAAAAPSEKSANGLPER